MTPRCMDIPIPPNANGARKRPDPSLKDMT